MILNAHRKRDLFAKEDIAVIDVLANDKVAQRVAIPQIRHNSDQDREQSREEKRWLSCEQAEHKEKQRQPIPGTASFEQFLIIVDGHVILSASEGSVSIHLHILPATRRWRNFLNRHRCVLYDSVDNLHILLPANT